MEDQTDDLKEIDLSMDFPHIQRSLGVSWDVTEDAFTFQVTDNPYTQRRDLLTINSLFDLLGHFLPLLTQEIVKWDEWDE